MKVLMLTKIFPYGTGEAFIENEIEILSKRYESVYIVACEVPKNETRIRIVPNNVKYYRIDTDSKKRQMTRDIIHSFLSKSSCSEEYYAEIHALNSYKCKVFFKYFEEKSQRVFSRIISTGVLDELEDNQYIFYSYWLFMTARVGALIANKITPCYMFTRTHSYDLYAERNALGYLPYRKYFLEVYDSIFPCCDDGTKYLQEKYKALSSKIVTGYLGTKDYGIGGWHKDGVFRIVSCSRVESVKRIHRIIDALKLLDNQKMQIEWVHIGGGSLLKRMMKKANQELKNIKYIFLGDQKNESVMNYYKHTKIDLFINVSRHEGLPVSIMEAISFGIPVIATNVGGTSEIIVDNITGRLIHENFTSEELAELIIKFYKMRNSKEYLDYRARCREYWQEHFQAIKNYNQMYNYIDHEYMTLEKH